MPPPPTGRPGVGGGRSLPSPLPSSPPSEGRGRAGKLEGVSHIGSHGVSSPPPAVWWEGWGGGGGSGCEGLGF